MWFAALVVGGASTNAAVEAPPANDAFLEVHLLRKQPGLVRGGATFGWLSIPQADADEVLSACDGDCRAVGVGRYARH